MIKAYILQQRPSHHDIDYAKRHTAAIKEQHPDRIFIITLGEINVKYDYYHFFNEIQPWLIESNTPVYVLWAGPDMEIFPNIFGVNTLGSAFGNVSCVNGSMHYAKNINLLETSDKLFTCYNNNPKYERQFLVDHLVKNDLLNDGIVTYHYPKTLATGYRWKYHDGSRLVDEPDYKIDLRPEYTAGIIPKSYFRGLIDIVCETDTQEGYFIPTEKNAKPWGTLKPYLVVSSVNYHQWLYDEYGIEPYTEMFDYSFDSEKKVEDRIQGIIENLKTWKLKFSKDPSAKEAIYNKILPKLKKNRSAARNTLHTLKLKDKVIPDCLKFITESEYELLGESVNTGGGLHFLTDPEWHRNYG